MLMMQRNRNYSHFLYYLGGWQADKARYFLFPGLQDKRKGMSKPIAGDSCVLLIESALHTYVGSPSDMGDWPLLGEHHKPHSAVFERGKVQAVWHTRRHPSGLRGGQLLVICSG